MKVSVAAILISSILGIAVGLGSQQGSRSLPGLIDAERAFSRMSEDKGLREAFLAYLADDSIVFRPKPVPGKKIYEDMPAASSISLTWSPEYAEVSVLGDLGYTTGPYVAKDRAKPTELPRYGHYVSVWERQANREWKVSLDAGIRHPQPGASSPAVATLPAGFKSWRGPRIDRDAERAALLNQEREFGLKARAEGLTEAYLLYAAPDIRFYRDGALPVTGKAVLLKLVSGASQKCRWGPVDAVVSSTGDLGYVFGEAEGVSADNSSLFETSSYLRIWRKTAGGEWRIALDLTVPVPAGPGSN